MRPRVFPAEDVGGGAKTKTHPESASMRPRVFPAEDVSYHQDESPDLLSFNEAAGIPRGRPGLPPKRRRGTLASMRPRVFPAEDAACRAHRVCGLVRLQ